MAVSRSNLADFASFLAIARHRSISRAGLELGVSASALSHALKGLEARLAIRLVNRTTRSVTLTAAGKQLFAALSGPMAAIGQAVDDLNRFREGPSGRVRLNVPHDAASYLLAPVLPSFVERYPDVELEVAVGNRLIDVVDGGFDAGIRFGGTVPEDMVAQRLSADIRWVVVGSPAYLDHFGTPAHPDDLQHHRCLRIRLGSGHLYRWDFERGGEEIAVAVPGPITIDESHFALKVVTLGGGLIYAPEPAVADLVAAGSLRVVLEDWLPMGPGYHAYYSGRRHVPVGLRLLIEHIREMKPLGL